MSIVSLSDLLAGARPDSHCVAIQDGQQITLARLRADVSHNADRLSTRADPTRQPWSARTATGSSSAYSRW